MDRRNSFSSRSGPRFDRAALEFVKARVFDPADFTMRGDGVVRLNPQLARHVAGSCYSLREKVEMP
jgi:hypothetical protein